MTLLTLLLRRYLDAIARVAKVSTPDAVDDMLSRVKTLYITHASPEACESAAVVCRSFSRRAPDVFRNVVSLVLPLAFFGMYDVSKTVQALWADIWREVSVIFLFK